MKTIRLTLITILMGAGFSACEKPESDHTRAMFSITKKTTTAPMHVILANMTAAATVVEWNLGNGKTSTLDQVEVIYNHPGTYNITLKVRRDGKEYSTVQQLTVEQDPGLLAYYPFNNTLKDTSGRSGDVSLFGTVNYMAVSPGDKGLHFADQSYARLPHGILSNLPAGTPYSISLWFKLGMRPSAFLGFTDNPNNAGSPNPPTQFGSLFNSHGVGIQGDFQVHSHNGQTRVSNVVNLIQWHHMVLVSDGINSTVYLDGNPPYVFPGFNIGNLPYGYLGYSYIAGHDIYLDGMMDDVRIYKRMLDRPEIEAIRKAY